jgi:septum formation protein
MPALVLASTSPYRKKLLARLGLPFEAIAPDCDEDQLKAGLRLEPAALALTLARAKAESLRASQPGAVIVGGDQLVELDGDVLGKPGTAERAVAQLGRLRGRSHRLLTAMVLALPDGSVREHLDVHTLTMAALSDDALTRYVASDLPLDCAGSYKIESRGVALLTQVEGHDPSAIEGLPLMALASALRGLGFQIP